MKLTLSNANQPFSGSVIDIANLVAGRERFRIQSVPLLGRILWDDDKQTEIEKPFDGEKLEKETGVSIELHWFESVSTGEKRDIDQKQLYPKRLGKIYIGTKWTGPLFYISCEERLHDAGTVRTENHTFYCCFSKGNYGGKFASGGNWTHSANVVTEAWRKCTEEERASGKGEQTQDGTPEMGFRSMREAFDYRFDRATLARNGQTRLFTESVELRDHVEEVLRKIGLLNSGPSPLNGQSVSFSPVRMPNAAQKAYRVAYVIAAPYFCCGDIPALLSAGTLNRLTSECPSL